MAYHRNPDWRWEYGAADATTGLLIVAAILVIALAATAVVVLFSELARVFKERAFQKTITARILWVTLATMLGLWLVSGLLAYSGDPQVGAILAAWSFLVFCLITEGCDLYERRQPHVDETGLLTYPVAPALSAVGANGHQNGAFEELLPEGWVLGEDVQW